MVSGFRSTSGCRFKKCHRCPSVFAQVPLVLFLAPGRMEGLIASLLLLVNAVMQVHWVRDLRFRRFLLGSESVISHRGMVGWAY